ncbi:hypothetical protein ACWEVP_02500 [Amycolatopsis sp. NPDC003865]
MTTVPESGVTSVAATASRLDLPEPDGPTSAVRGEPMRHRGSRHGQEWRVTGPAHTHTGRGSTRVAHGLGRENHLLGQLFGEPAAMRSDDATTRDLDGATTGMLTRSV